MKLIAGLGNPGTQYERTRHNAGFLAVDRVVRSLGPASAIRQRFGAETAELTVAGEKCVLVKPMRFMNCSGAAISEALNFYKLDPTSDLLVLVDDYSLPLGSIRIRAEGSAGGHNGLSDIQRALSSTAYPRLRIGIDGPPAGYDDPADWVLGRFTDEQYKLLQPVLDRVSSAVEAFVRAGLTEAMNKFNTKVAPTSPSATAPTARTSPTTPSSPTPPIPASLKAPPASI